MNSDRRAELTDSSIAALGVTWFPAKTRLGERISLTQAPARWSCWPVSAT